MEAKGSDGSSARGAELSKCEDLWFDDGTIVLQAEQTLFRVYRGLLVQNSEIFADMFSLPTLNSGGGDLIEGCQVVFLHDTAQELTHFLKAIFVFGYAEKMLLTDRSFYLGALKLSTKYSSQAIRRRIISELSHIFPDTWSRFRTFDSWPTHQVFIQNVVLGAQLACLGQARTLLPSALYCFTSLSTKMIFDQIFFSEKEKRQCVLGREAIIAEYKKLGNELRNCRKSAPCDSRRYCPTLAGWPSLLAQERLLTRADAIACPFILHESHDLIRDEGVCAACYIKARQVYDEGRQRIWDGLPAYFEMESWEALRRDTEY
ncbi:hypothetical protein OE88DRAFT_1666251 [Heliocybe sulcata]|uniref:BTB domain-containing protein n=1 Tax=Heliocybe sulcata TaxID=5364 RepID=A0A5C3MRH7_9AGAM|nr:hypothetical protein OE88DRAFT_1666251 [Heliocybe sulcata]